MKKLNKHFKNFYMKNFMTKIFAKQFFIFCTLLTLGIQESIAQFQVGDVFVAVSNGQVQRRSSTGVLLQTLNTGLGGFTTGMAFDASDNLYVTNFSVSSVSKFNSNGVLQGIFGSGYGIPESIVFDGAGNAYVGNLSNGIRKYNSTGTYLSTSYGGRTDFIDLAADGCTMLRTTEGSSIERHDVCTNTVLSAFTTGTGGNAFALRIRQNGEVLLANRFNVKRFSAAGALLQTYTVTGEDSWFALNLSLDGTSFWSANFNTANVYRIDIATGNVLTTFNTSTGSGTVYGLAVFGEYQAAICAANTAPAFVSPTPTCGSTIQANAGVPLSFTVSASDANAADVVNLNATGIPAGATMTPSLPATGNPVSSTFSWTPTVTDVGLHVITFKAADKCVEVPCSITIDVQAGCNITVTAKKFYDLNTNGVDDDNLPVENWSISLSGTDENSVPVGPLNQYTNAAGTTAFTPLAKGSYTVTEGNQTGWIHTTATSASLSLTTCVDPATVLFGNVCLGAGRTGGGGLGYWTNKNGQALLTGSSLCALNALCLRNADGTNYDPISGCPAPTNPQVNAGKTSLKNWLLNAYATNMSYMLSAQFATLKLNVLLGYVDGTRLIYAPGTSSANAAGFASVNDVMAEANTLLCANGVISSGNPLRARAEAVKNALEGASSNYNFVQLQPCAVALPTASTQNISMPIVTEKPVEANALWLVKASPNPSKDFFSLTIISDNRMEGITLRVIDFQGRVMETRNGLRSGQTIQVGNNLRPGTYLIETVQGTDRRSQTIIKQ